MKVPVSVMNDAKSAAMAEARWGALADCKDGIVIVLGTGIGGALIKDGKVHFGKSFAAGEFSFINLSESMDSMDSTWAGRAGNPRLRALVANAKGLKIRSLLRVLTCFAGQGRGIRWFLWR